MRKRQTGDDAMLRSYLDGLQKDGKILADTCDVDSEHAPIPNPFLDDETSSEAFKLDSSTEAGTDSDASTNSCDPSTAVSKSYHLRGPRQTTYKKEMLRKTPHQGAIKAAAIARAECSPARMRALDETLKEALLEKTYRSKSYRGSEQLDTGLPTRPCSGPKSLECLRNLIRVGAGIDHDGMTTALDWELAHQCRAEAFKLFLLYGAYFDSTQILSRIAIKTRSSVPELEVFLQYGAEVNGYCPSYAGVTNTIPLYLAAIHGNSAAVSLLLRYGADPHFDLVPQKDESREWLRHGTTLNAACSTEAGVPSENKSAARQIVELLLTHGVKMNSIAQHTGRTGGRATYESAKRLWERSRVLKLNEPTKHIQEALQEKLDILQLLEDHGTEEVSFEIWHLACWRKEIWRWKHWLKWEEKQYQEMGWLRRIFASRPRIMRYEKTNSESRASE